jgi:hypothetical protein
MTEKEKREFDKNASYKAGYFNGMKSRHDGVCRLHLATLAVYRGLYRRGYTLGYAIPIDDNPYFEKEWSD